MQATQIQTYARQLLEAEGSRAIADAAQRALKAERRGESEQAKTWRRVELALLQMRGPRES